MWENYNEFMSKQYFVEKHWLRSDESIGEFDIQVNERSCAQYKKDETICDLCFNTALLEKIQKLTSLQRLDFVNYQINKYEDALDWLKRFQAFLKDNEESFDSFNYKIQQEFLEIARQGIQQLSKKTETNTEPDEF